MYCTANKAENEAITSENLLIKTDTTCIMTLQLFYTKFIVTPKTALHYGHNSNHENDLSTGVSYHFCRMFFHNPETFKTHFSAIMSLNAASK
jgi:hypothetical protein